MPRLSYPVGPGWGLRISLSDKFPGDADASGPGTILWEALPRYIQPNSGWIAAKSSINHMLHLSAEEAVSCVRVRIGFAEEQAFVWVLKDGEVSIEERSLCLEGVVATKLGGGQVHYLGWDEEVRMERERPERSQEDSLCQTERAFAFYHVGSGSWWRFISSRIM